MSSLTNGLAVCLAALGALLFGLAAVRQHGAVQSAVRPGIDAAAPTRTDARTPAAALSWAVARLSSAARVVRQPAWLLGAGQAGLGGALHMTALVLAPITLVQPLGVLAVPVTVVRAATARRRWPSRTQVVGTALSVAGVVALTVVLLGSSGQDVVLPSLSTLVLAAGCVVVAALVLELALRRAPHAVQCVGRAVVAASLFGLGSVLVRVVGRSLITTPSAVVGLIVAALLALAVVLPLGIWSMQSAYVVGAPQVVICCLTLIDPVAAIVGGRVLLGDGAAMSGTMLVVAVACGLCAAAGVVLLARDYPAEDQPRTPRGPVDGAREHPSEQTLETSVSSTKDGQRDLLRLAR